MTERGELVYSGKAKSLYAHLNEPDLMIMEFRNDTSRFDGEKIEALDRKGLVSNYINAFIMNHLSEAGYPTHFQERISDTESIVSKLDMIPVESVARNVAAGGFCRRYGELLHGDELEPPVQEFFVKDDSRHDPMVSDTGAVALGLATFDQLNEMTRQTSLINACLVKLFKKAELTLVDFKIEFGTNSDGVIVIGDEITPDGCRLWDIETKEILDKDRFRKDLGQVVESYEEVARRLGVKLP